jgi:hypothetical protein
MEGEFMSKKELFSFQTITDYLAGKLLRSEAAILLNVSTRTVSRRARKVEAQGVLGSKHGNSGKAPVNKIPAIQKEGVMDLVKSQYFDFNMTHSLEKLRDIHKIHVTYEVFRKWCHEHRVVKRKQRRRSKPRCYRDRMPSEGLLLQMDGSHHRWNRDEEWCLIAAIDDATSDIPYAEFFPGEQTLPCMKVIHRIIERKGIPHTLYVDRAGLFGGQKRQDFSQFKRACEELNIHIIFANSPQAKGRIERAFNTLQDRVIPEMRIRNIHRMSTANKFLLEQFIPQYWKNNCVVTPRDLESKYKPLPKHIDLNEIFCLKDYRFVKADHTIQWHSKRYLLESPIKYSIWKQQIEIRTYQDNTWKAFFAGKELHLKQVYPMKPAA